MILDKVQKQLLLQGYDLPYCLKLSEKLSVYYNEYQCFDYHGYIGEKAYINKVQHLFFSQNIISIKSLFSSMLAKNLQCLNLSSIKNAKWNKIEANILEKLKDLSITCCALSDIHFFQKLATPCLKTLDLSTNKIANLRTFETPPNLKVLYLKENILHDLNNLNISGLEILNLYSNCISDVSIFDKEHKIQRLILSNNKISKLNLGLFESLSLHLSNNKIKDLSILKNQKLERLEKLALLNNKITDISPLLSCDIPNLHFLDLGGNNISNVKALSEKWPKAKIHT